MKKCKYCEKVIDINKIFCNKLCHNNYMRVSENNPRYKTNGWNKGLTKENNLSILSRSKKISGKNHWNYGNNMKKETIEKIRKHTIIQFKNGMPEETKQKISIKNKINAKNPTKQMIEGYKKLSKKLKGRIINNEWRQNIRNGRAKQKNTWESSIEKKIQSFLIELKVPFIVHKLIGDIEHRYQCDIYIPDLNMIIECDGDYWHNLPNIKETDKIRNKELKEKNYKLLRLWERDIKNMNITQFRSTLCESYYKQIKNKGD